MLEFIKENGAILAIIIVALGYLFKQILSSVQFQYNTKYNTFISLLENLQKSFTEMKLVVVKYNAMSYSNLNNDDIQEFSKEYNNANSNFQIAKSQIEPFLTDDQIDILERISKLLRNTVIAIIGYYKLFNAEIFSKKEEMMSDRFKALNEANESFQNDMPEITKEFNKSLKLVPVPFWKFWKLWA